MGEEGLAISITVFKTFTSGEILTAADLNSSFLQIINNALSLISPLTGTLDVDGNEVILDSDADTSLRANTDDLLDLKLGGTVLMSFDGATASSVNGFTFYTSATGNAVRVLARGTDANISINLVPKGTGSVQIAGTAINSAEYENDVLMPQVFS